MDEQASYAEIDGSKQQGPVPVSLGEPLIGSWTLEKNFPFGFVIRNTDPNSCGTEYHFQHESNGWISSKIKGEHNVLGPRGILNLTPVFCDLESTKKLERISELRKKGQDLTPEESMELLKISGLIRGK